MGHEKPVQNVMEYDWLNEEEKRAIIGGNACRILGLKAPEDA
jgi:hypothetical protein